MTGGCILFSVFATLCVVGGVYMIVTKRPVLFHGYHYANVSARAKGKLAVYGGLGMFIFGIGCIGGLFHYIGWPTWMKIECGDVVTAALLITGGVTMALSVVCCKGRLLSWIFHWREDQDKNCDD